MKLEFRHEVSIVTLIAVAIVGGCFYEYRVHMNKIKVESQANKHLLDSLANDIRKAKP